LWYRDDPFPFLNSFYKRLNLDKCSNSNMRLYIKNMVCDRCILVVRDLLEKKELPYKNIQLGEVELVDVPSSGQLEQLAGSLTQLGFELLDDRKTEMVNRIKTTIIQLIQNANSEELNKKTSVILSKKLGKDYHFLSNLFSTVEGVTIEKYIILQRIEKAKELLMYDELNIVQIAEQLGYSSVQHLSQQFKKVTGLSPSHFKKIKENRRRPLDKI
jgi:AraC family transcriptional regulator